MPGDGAKHELGRRSEPIDKLVEAVRGEEIHHRVRTCVARIERCRALPPRAAVCHLRLTSLLDATLPDCYSSRIGPC